MVLCLLTPKGFQIIHRKTPDDARTPVLSSSVLIHVVARSRLKWLRL